MTVARELAGFLARTAAADLTAPAIDHAAMLIASTIASAGVRPRAQIRHDHPRSWRGERGGRPDAAVWFEDRRRLPLADAAQVNAVMSDAAACDDSDLRNIVHCGTPLTATSLAVAERTGADGEACWRRSCSAMRRRGGSARRSPRASATSGFHGCLAAIFAAAVAAARLLRLDAERWRRRSPCRRPRSAGSPPRPTPASRANTMPGWRRCSGSMRHWRRSADSMPKKASSKTRLGFFAVYGGSTAPSRPARSQRAISGRSWDIVTDMAIKLVPGGHPYHALAEAAANAAREGGFAAG